MFANHAFETSHIIHCIIYNFICSHIELQTHVDTSEADEQNYVFGSHLSLLVEELYYFNTGMLFFGTSCTRGREKMTFEKYMQRYITIIGLYISHSFVTGKQ